MAERNRVLLGVARGVTFSIVESGYSCSVIQGGSQVANRWLRALLTEGVCTNLKQKGVQICQAIHSALAFVKTTGN